MAGAGYKLFQTGDVLTAAQVNTYLNEQTVMVFANAAARTSALTSVLAEGMVSYLQDTNAVEVYNGSAWVGVSGAGDVTEVQAGTGISVASGTGPIPIVTSTVATTFDAKGDLVVGTGADTFAKLTVGGTNGHTLQVDSSTATGLKWAAAAGGGGLTLINTGGTTLSGASTSITSIPGTYKNLHIYIENFSMGSNNNNGYIQFNGTTSDNYAFGAQRRSGGSSEANATEGNNDVGIYFISVAGTTGEGGFAYLLVPDYAATNHRKVLTGVSYTINSDSPTPAYYVMNPFGVLQNSNSAITSVQVVSNGTYAGGTVYVYGEN